MSEEKGKGHSSYSVWLVYCFRAIEKILPALKGKQKWGWVAGFLICLVLFVSVLGFGIYSDGYIIHPPAQYEGVCSPPSVIQKGNCVLITSEVVTVSGTASTQLHTQQAGVIVSTTRTVTSTVTK